jgi:hypothetical protein
MFQIIFCEFLRKISRAKFAELSRGLKFQKVKGAILGILFLSSKFQQTHALIDVLKVLLG